MIRKNINYLIIKRVSSIKELNLIINNYSLGISKEKFNNFYNNVIKDFTNFILLDLDSHPDDRFRVNFKTVNINEYLKNWIIKSNYIIYIINVIISHNIINWWTTFKFRLTFLRKLLRNEP